MLIQTYTKIAVNCFPIWEEENSNFGKKKVCCHVTPSFIKLTPDIKVFPISIPLKALEQDTDYTVKLPIQHFFSAPLLTTQALKLRLEKKTLPLLWSMHLGCQHSLLLCKMSLAEGIHVAPVVQVSLRINRIAAVMISYRPPRNQNLVKSLVTRDFSSAYNDI